MKLKINFLLIIISFFLLLPSFAFTANEPVDTLLTIDDSRLMEKQINDSPISQQERDSWLQFK